MKFKMGDKVKVNNREGTIQATGIFYSLVLFTDDSTEASFSNDKIKLLDDNGDEE